MSHASLLLRVWSLYLSLLQTNDQKCIQVSSIFYNLSLGAAAKWQKSLVLFEADLRGVSL